MLFFSRQSAWGEVLIKAIDYGIVNNLTAVGDRLFFTTGTTTQTTHSPHALWTSDGTPEGTLLIKEFNPESTFRKLSSFTSVGDILFFRGFDPDHGRELWMSDGTNEGTILVSDINPGRRWAQPLDFNPPLDSNPSSLINVNGLLFFSADDGTHGRELWASDGTPEGTFLVSDINPGIGSSSPRKLTYVDGDLFFIAFTSPGVAELVKVDVRSIVRNIIDGDDQDNYIVGTERDDEINGMAGNDVLVGGNGKDKLRGGQGYDVLIGGENDDLLDGGPGADGLVGGPGPDEFLLRVEANSGEDVIYDFQKGTDQILLEGLTFDQLGITYDSPNLAAIITFRETNQHLSTLPGLQAGSLGSEDFVTI